MEIIRVQNLKLIDAENMSSSIVGDSIPLDSVRTFAIQAVWSGATGASSGDLILTEVSNDNVTYTILDSHPLGSNTSGTYYKNFADEGAAYMRVSYTKSVTSAGSLTVRVNSKN